MKDRGHKPPRLDPPDTVDDVHMLLSALQAEGWHMSGLGMEWHYSDPGKHGRLLPIGLTLNITLKV